MTTGDVTIKSSTEVALSGSFSQATATPTEVGFYYGTSSTSMTNRAYTTVSGSDAGSFECTVRNLNPNSKYYYQAYVTVAGTGSYASQTQTLRSSVVMSFTTPDDSQTSDVQAALNYGWLELPGAQGNQEYVQTAFDGSARNYSYNYDKDMFTSLWVAYPLYSATTTGSNTAGWKFNPYIPMDYQIDVTGSSYQVNYGSTTTNDYDSTKEFYARGHQIPNADRKSTATMNSQTYYVTNSTPQIQNGFNGGIWSNLEKEVRNQIPSNDTLYVVTGAAFQKIGESVKPVTWIYPKGGGSCPVPNFYWKALLKVKRGTGGKVTSASAIGFWLPHEDLSGKNYEDYAVSIQQLQQWTGFDFFVNLPDSVESSAESENSWSDFGNF